MWWLTLLLICFSLSLRVSADVFSPRIRKEIRKLSPTAWNRIVSAIKVMKYTPDDEGAELYGPWFRSYDTLVAQHAAASLDPNGDNAHFSEVFSIFHRAWCLAFENSIIAIDPKIRGLPYWDFSLDAKKDDDNDFPTVFSSTYLGSSGDPESGYAVTDGPFAYWPIANDTSIFGLDFSSPYGYLRHPVSVNPSPFMTRRLNSLCGIEFDMGNKMSYRECNVIEPDISLYRQCIDPSLHGPAHLAIGGSWKRASQLDREDSPSCAQWYGQIRPRGENDTEPLYLEKMGSFVSAWAMGCFNCPGKDEKCTLDEDPDACICTRKDPDPKSCGPLWTELIREEERDPSLNYKATLTPCADLQIIGDFVDAVCSPNDVVFAFHHSNMDRVFYNWMKNFEGSTLEEMAYFNYPREGLAYGSNLDDPLCPLWPFTDLVPGSFPDDPNHMYTVRDVFDLTFPISKGPYTYDQTEYHLIPPVPAVAEDPELGNTNLGAGQDEQSGDRGGMRRHLRQARDETNADSSDSSGSSRSTPLGAAAVLLLLVIPAVTFSALIVSANRWQSATTKSAKASSLRQRKTSTKKLAG